MNKLSNEEKPLISNALFNSHLFQPSNQGILLLVFTPNLNTNVYGTCEETKIPGFANESDM